MNAENRLYGGFRAIVKDTADPEKVGRVRVFIPAVMSGSADDQRQWSNWCEPKFVRAGKDGTADVGAVCVPPVGSRVWVEFEQGNPDFPVYDGGFYAPNTNTTPPKVSVGEDDGLTPATRTVSGVSVPGARSNTPEYPTNVVFKTPRGITIEVDDTPTGGRVRVQMPRIGGEGVKGAFIEFANNGDLIVRAADSGKLQLAAAELLAAVNDVKLGVSGKVYAGSATALHPAVIDNQFLTNLNQVLTLLAAWAAAVDVAIPLGAAPTPPSTTLVTAISSVFSPALNSYRATKLNSE